MYICFQIYAFSHISYKIVAGRAEGRQEKHSECRPRSPSYRRKYEEQLKQFADSRIHEDVATR